MGFWAFMQYAAATGGLDLANLSAKRTAFYSGSGQYSGGAGQWRALNELSTVAFLMVVARFASTTTRMTIAQKVSALALFANAALLPFYSSTRSQIIYIILTALAVHVCLRGGIKFRSIVGVAVAALLILSVSTFLRQQSEGDSAAFDIATSISDAMVLNLNFTEVPKAVNIIEAVPERLPYTNGSTIANYAVAWVPRSMWPGKPIIDPGVPVGVHVYGTDGTAIPPAPWPSSTGPADS